MSMAPHRNTDATQDAGGLSDSLAAGVRRACIPSPARVITALVACPGRLYRTIALWLFFAGWTLAVLRDQVAGRDVGGDVRIE